MTIRYEPQGPVVVIRLDRPDRANSLDADTWSLLAGAWERFESDDKARVAVLTGSPHPWFSGGFDITAAKGHPGQRLFLPAGGQRDPFYSGSMTKPVIAAVNGAAVGAGAYMVLRADMRVLADEAFLALPEIDYGRAVGWELFPQEQMPAALAAELVAGFHIPAKRLFAAGLANRLCAASDVVSEACGLAEELARKPQRAINAVLQLVRRCRNENIELHPAVVIAGDEIDAELAEGREHREMVATRLGRVGES